MICDRCQGNGSSAATGDEPDPHEETRVGWGVGLAVLGILAVIGVASKAGALDVEAKKAEKEAEAA